MPMYGRAETRKRSTFLFGDGEAFITHEVLPRTCRLL